MISHEDSVATMAQRYWIPFDMQEYTLSDLCLLGDNLTQSVGEVVWDLGLCIDGKTVMYDHHWTSQLSLDCIWQRLDHWNTDAGWHGFVRDDTEIRLFLRENETYSLESRVFRKSTQKSNTDAFWSFLRLPQEMWWVAPFVCPFCGTLCRGVSGRCEHQLIASGQLCDPYRSKLPRLSQICDEISKLTLVGDFVNVHIDGIMVKTARQPLPREWFRQSYVYTESMKSAESLESLVEQQTCITKR